jgi:hypothetical protein
LANSNNGPTAAERLADDQMRSGWAEAGSEKASWLSSSVSESNFSFSRSDSVESSWGGRASYGGGDDSNRFLVDGPAGAGAAGFDEADVGPGRSYPSTGQTIYEGNSVSYKASFDARNNVWALDTADGRGMPIISRSWGPSGEFVSGYGGAEFNQSLDAKYEAGTLNMFSAISDVWRADSPLSQKLSQSYDWATYAHPEGMTYGNVPVAEPNLRAAAFDNMLGNPFSAIVGGYMAWRGASTENIYHATTAASAAGSLLGALSGYGGQRTVSPVSVPGRQAGADNLGPQVLFGQKRIGPDFGAGGGRPAYISGRSIRDVADDLRNGILHPDQFPVEAFYFKGKLVSQNTRTLSALSDAGMEPTIVKIVEPSRNVLRRLQERPLISDGALPGPRVPVTPSMVNLSVQRIIEIPGRKK